LLSFVVAADVGIDDSDVKQSTNVTLLHAYREWQKCAPRLCLTLLNLVYSNPELVPSLNDGAANILKVVIQSTTRDTDPEYN